MVAVQEVLNATEIGFGGDALVLRSHLRCSGIVSPRDEHDAVGGVAQGVVGWVWIPVVGAGTCADGLVKSGFSEGTHFWGSFGEKEEYGDRGRP